MYCKKCSPYVMHQNRRICILLCVSLVTMLALHFRFSKIFDSISPNHKTVKSTRIVDERLHSSPRKDESKLVTHMYESEKEFMIRMSLRMKQRKDLLQKTCKQLGLHKSSFQQQLLMVIKEYKLLHCRVPKAGSTSMDVVLTQILDKVKKTNDPHGIEGRTEQHFQTAKNTTGFLRSIIVREPYDRLVSAYKRKIHGKNATGRINTSWDKPSLVPYNVTFDQFIEHVTYPGRRQTQFERHWSTFIQLCQPCHINYDVIGRLETIEEDSRYLLNLIGAPRNITFPNMNSHQDPDYKLTFANVTRRNLESLRKMFLNDYRLFNYSFPTDLRQSTK